MGKKEIKEHFELIADEYDKWKDKNSDLADRGWGEPLGQAYPDIKRRWKAYGEAIGVR